MPINLVAQPDPAAVQILASSKQHHLAIVISNSDFKKIIRNCINTGKQCNHRRFSVIRTYVLDLELTS